MKKEYEESDAEIKEAKIRFYNSLSEKDRRRYAGMEAKQFGFGGIAYMASLFDCDEKTIAKGISELYDEECMKQARIRAVGGGRRSKLEKYENIDAVFLEILRLNTAGDPMDDKVKWTNLSKAEIAEGMLKKGIKISRNIVKKLLKKHGYVKRKALKKKSTGEHKDRNEQFVKMASLRKTYEESDNPIISIDAKKKELIGNLSRNGTLECIEPVEVFDHDFPHLAEAKITPYGVYDLKANKCLVNIGTSHSTSRFSCDSVKIWWKTTGKKEYPNATSILMLADNGNPNSSHHHIFKEDLQELSNELGIEIRVAHYPPYTSKWNPIEHRVFPHITRSLSGVILVSVSLAKELIKKTKTKTGLKVLVRLSKKTYEKGRKVAADFYEKANIKHDEVLGAWNYVVRPNC